MGAPLAVSMLIQAIYNIVDSIFVSLSGRNALTAVSAFISHFYVDDLRRGRYRCWHQLHLAPSGRKAA